MYTVRCLLLKERDPVKWNTLKLMMDHNKEREAQDHWQHCQHNIVNYLRNHWKMDCTPEEINHVIGLIEVNAFEVKLSCDPNNDDDISERGIQKVIYHQLKNLLNRSWKGRVSPACKIVTWLHQ